MPKYAGKVFSVAVGLLALAAFSAAQVPMGPEFRVDSHHGIPFQFWTQRSVSMTRDGRFVVAWTEQLPDNEIMARRFSAGGSPLGAEFRVNSYTTDEQYNPTVASDDAGNFVVVWISQSQDGSENGVYAQRFNAAGTPLGAEFRVNQATVDHQWRQSVAMRGNGEFIVVWTSSVGTSVNVFARRYAASGAPIGGEFQVNTTPLAEDPVVDYDGAGNFVVVWGAGNPQIDARGRLFSAAGAPLGQEFALTGGLYLDPRVARKSDGSFVVVWSGTTPGSAYTGIGARRFDANGTPVGSAFRVNAGTVGRADRPAVVVDGDGDFVVVWEDEDQSTTGIAGRRFDSAGAASPEFRVNTYTWSNQWFASVATDSAGNFVVAWHSGLQRGGGVFAQRYAGGLNGTSLSVDASAGPASDGNGVFEAGETAVVAPSWLNGDFDPFTFSGTASGFTGPGPVGDPSYTINDGSATYGMVAAGSTSSCTATGDCYVFEITPPTTRPAVHWDADFMEQLAPANIAVPKPWLVHVGGSFSDVPRANPFYRFVETLLHHGVTAGCAATTYCPGASTTREQMAVFVLVAKEGRTYVPPPCAFVLFFDVPVSSPFCPWIQELARRGVVGGCGGGNYCPAEPVSRQEMAVFSLATKDEGVAPPACGTTPMFNDVPPSSSFCRWIEELARRGVVTGCGAGAYCPTAPVIREQMGVFLSMTFRLLLYGP